MILALLLASAAAATPPRILARMEGERQIDGSIIAELVERPSGLSDAEFAEKLVKAEGLTSYDGKPMTSYSARQGMSSKIMMSGDGGTVIVFYTSGAPSRRKGKVCRIRSQFTSVPAHYPLRRWCAAAFGISLPETPPPPVGTVSIPPPR